jgi:hypothetical protein
VVSALLTLLLLVPLSALSVQFFRQATDNRQINQVVLEEVNRFGAELAALQTTGSGNTLDLVISMRSSKALSYQEVVDLQRNLAIRLQRPVSIIVNQVLAARLDPLIPPTQTPTPTPVTVTPTVTSSPTFTSTPTATSTPLPTATPATARLSTTGGRPVDLLQSPGGPAIGRLQPGTDFTVLYGWEIEDGLVWLQVQDPDGRIGWIPEIDLSVVTLTPTPTLTPTANP